MKLLLASTPATGHVNPMIAIASFLIEDGHDVVFLCEPPFRERIERCGATFREIPSAAEDVHTRAPELRTMAPGFDWLRVAIEKIFIERVPEQHKYLLETLKEFPADTILVDDMFFGIVPMLLAQSSKRPAIVACGTSVLHWRREDKAPLFAGLPPATTPERLQQYAAIAQDYFERVDRPTLEKMNAVLKSMGIGSLTIPLFESTVAYPDTYMQLSVPGLEYPRPMPSSVNFVGALPIIPGQAPIPEWADDLDGSRKVVLVTQGTVANHNFGLLVGPTMAALADETDVFVVVTAGGRPVEELPGPIPQNARVSQFLPFDWLLPKVDVLVTNGGYGSVNQALSYGIPIVAAGLTEDKADVNARIAWSGAGIDLKSNSPAPEAIRVAVRTLLDKPDHRQKAERLAAEYASYDAKEETLRLLRQRSRTAMVA